MNEMQGFRNAPSITEFAVGMRVRRCSEKYVGEWFTVAIVMPNHPSDAPVDFGGVQKCGHVGSFDLDLDSVWVGRKYHRPDCFPEIDWTVSCVGNGYVGVVHGDTGGCWPMDQFRKTFAPLPLDSAEAPANVAKEEWKPEEGEECLWVDVEATGGKTTRVIFLYHDEKEGLWVCRVIGEHGDLSYEGIPGCLLRPIPSEPPVKVGDIVLLTRDPDEPKIAGTVTEVFPEKHEFYVVNWGMFSWDDSRVTITKLVPDTLYAKMRKRLEELRVTASRNGWHVIVHELALALADLEAYAKESQ
jgi:hypothetical protein